jgi:hypothetical protein
VVVRRELVVLAAERVARSWCIESFTISARMPSTFAFISRSMRRTSGCSMIGTRGALGSFHCVIELPCLRSFA